MTDTKNIILIGRTGNGKSTLANVLTNSNEFTESAGSTSETRGIQIEEFEEAIDTSGEQKIKYKVIDTVGIGDTRLTTQGVLYRLAEASYHIKEGLNQILFVTNGRFTKEEINTFGLLKSVIFDKRVAEYTTIVRTNFPDFEDQNECDNDQQKLRNENESLFNILGACKIIYIDNPPLKGRSAATNRDIREESRKRLLIYLATCQGIYKPENLDAMNDRIGSYMTENEKILQELENLKKVSEEEKKLSEEEKRKLTELIKSLEAQSKDLQKQIVDGAEQRTRGRCTIL
ncbi:9583_t:CDS:1 [Ambispora leptoticha]|uniref:9583_t:CDS:1 n=1 Tax=Ambispora leptoticha TaxID=144679 RepID=A0A9N9CTU7_9GLOM|nr:9583_t:CDS:1 [Ambispora leptoticha]